jgi:hypothetical protein
VSAEQPDTELAIPLEVALRLCEEVLEANRHRLLDLAAWRCRECAYDSHGDSASRGFSTAPGNRGCPMVNQRWEELGRPMS